MLSELLAALLINESNFKIMHWMAKGKEFNAYHNDVTANYYDMCSDYADKVAEMNMRLGGTPLNYVEVFNKIKESNKHFVILKSDEYYTKEDIVNYTDNILATILEVIEEALQKEEIANNIKNVGIKADLESMHSAIDLQYRYLNERRK